MTVEYAKTQKCKFSETINTDKIRIDEISIYNYIENEYWFCVEFLYYLPDLEPWGCNYC